ncbi:FG-GAP-like repeat-containing protein [Streptomyces sp. NPDC060131]|uniref:FG-GAP-like repeat-containing protein n=1 Tax=unclassified Streptomyces TaxID=2593676 RepID=UPI00364C5D5E
MRKRPLFIGTVVTGVALAGAWYLAAGTGASGVRSPVSLAAATAGSGKAADLNGDGYDDLAIGAPDGAVQGRAKAGYVTVTFGAKSDHAVGIASRKHQRLTPSSAGIPGAPQSDARFGSALALGDMDGDGYAELVVGASGANAGGVKGAGSVTIVFGSPGGLSARAITFHSPSLTTHQGFGGGLALGDFNGDGLQDLAVPDGDRVDIVLGAKDLRSTPSPRITRSGPPGGGAGTQGISTGDVNGDGFDDLVTVAHFDDPADQGTLGVLPGSKTGLKGSSLGRDISLPFAGYTAVAGDINGDGKDDVVIGTGFGDGPDDYLLRTFPGSADGLDAARAVAFKGGAYNSDRVHLADINGDGHADLLVGDTQAPDSDGFRDAGALVVATGGPEWLDSAERTVSLDTTGVTGVAENGDRFGSALAVGDYDGDGTTDVAVGVPGKWRDSGAVSMLHGSRDGLTGSGSIIFGPDEFGYGAVKTSFGASLAG